MQRAGFGEIRFSDPIFRFDSQEGVDLLLCFGWQHLRSPHLKERVQCPPRPEATQPRNEKRNVPQAPTNLFSGKSVSSTPPDTGGSDRLNHTPDGADDLFWLVKLNIVNIRARHDESAVARNLR